MFEVGRRKGEVRSAMREVRGKMGMMLIAVFALSMVPKFAHAQQTDSTLMKLTRMALERNPEIRAGAAAVGAAQQRGARVGALDDPEIMVQWFANPARSGGLRNVAFGVRQMMPWPGSLAAERAGAAAGARAREYALELARVQLTQAVAETWHARHGQARRIALAGEQLTWLARLEALARQRHELGLVSQAELLRIELEREKMRSELRIQELEASALDIRLRALTYAAPTDTLPVPAGPQRLIPFSDPSPGGSHPMLLEAGAMVQESESMSRRAALETRPMIGFGLEIMGPEFSMMESAFAWPIVPSVSMTLPIWRSKSTAIRREADFRVEEASARYDAALSALTAERAEAALMLRQADETVALYRDRMLPRSIELADLILLEYSTGKRMADEVIMARRETLELSMTLEMAITERNTALARLQSLYPTFDF